MDEIELMLKDLTESTGVSGYESDIKKVLNRYMSPLGEISGDKLGSMICRQQGTSESPKVVVAAHMDEVGFMVKYISPEGYIKFAPLGGWADQVLLAHRVSIITHKGPITGVLGAKPPHVMTDEERKKLLPKKEMYIDIGTSSLKEVEEAGVRIGDPVVPISDFIVMQNRENIFGQGF